MKSRSPGFKTASKACKSNLDRKMILRLKKLKLKKLMEVLIVQRLLQVNSQIQLLYLSLDYKSGPLTTKRRRALWICMFVMSILLRMLSTRSSSKLVLVPSRKSSLLSLRLMSRTTLSIITSTKSILK